MRLTYGDQAFLQRACDEAGISLADIKLIKYCTDAKTKDSMLAVQTDKMSFYVLLMNNTMFSSLSVGTVYEPKLTYHIELFPKNGDEYDINTAATLQYGSV